MQPSFCSGEAEARRALPAPVCTGEATASPIPSYALGGGKACGCCCKSHPAWWSLCTPLREPEQVWANCVKELRFGFVLAGQQLVMIMLCVYNYLLHAHIISQEQAAAMARRISYLAGKKATRSVWVMLPLYASFSNSSCHCSTLQSYTLELL